VADLGTVDDGRWGGYAEAVARRETLLSRPGPLATRCSAWPSAPALPAARISSPLLGDRGCQGRSFGNWNWNWNWTRTASLIGMVVPRPTRRRL